MDDPNATLKEIREICHLQLNGADTEGDFERLVELIGTLDDWLSKGGFLPKDWNQTIEALRNGHMGLWTAIYGGKVIGRYKTLDEAEYAVTEAEGMSTAEDRDWLLEISHYTTGPFGQPSHARAALYSYAAFNQHERAYRYNKARQARCSAPRPPLSHLRGAQPPPTLKT